MSFKHVEVKIYEKKSLIAGCMKEFNFKIKWRKCFKELRSRCHLNYLEFSGMVKFSTLQILDNYYFFHGAE